MKKGWLVVNHFLNTQKFSEIYSWLLKAAKARGLDLTLKTNVDLMCLVNENRFLDSALQLPDFVLFWDKDVHLARMMENLGLKLFNCADAIEICDNKSLTHIYLKKEEIPMPRTIIGPMTFYNIGYSDVHFVEQIEREFGYPFVIKESQGSFGMQVYLVTNREEAIKILEDTKGKTILFQEFLKSSFGTDIRIHVVGGKVVASMLRYNQSGDFRANVTNGGKMAKYEPTKEQIELAINTCDCLKLDFAGVDLLFGEQEEPLVCEVNSNAHFKNIYDCTGVNIADFIMDHILSYKEG